MSTTSLLLTDFAHWRRAQNPAKSDTRHNFISQVFGRTCCVLRGRAA